MTYRDLIESACADLNIIGAADTLDPDNAQFALNRLNDWIDALALEGLTITAIQRQTWVLGNGTASYTVGTGSTVNIPKPVNPQAISNIGFYDSTLTTPTEILFGACLTDDAYQNFLQKTMQASMPTGFYYDAGTGLTGTLYPLPIPNVSTLRGVIYAPSLLSEVALADTVSLPRGYRRFFRANLTVELAAAFEKPVPPAIQAIANDSKTRVKAANVRMVDLSFDAGLPGVTGGIYDINSDANY